MGKKIVNKEIEVVEVPVLVETPVLKGDQTIIGIGGGLVPDKEYNVSAQTASVLIAKGFATLKQ